jgi:hypothetical protein
MTRSLGFLGYVRAFTCTITPFSIRKLFIHAEVYAYKIVMITWEECHGFHFLSSGGHG